MTLAQAIKYHRLQAKLTQAQLGAMVGTNKICIHRWESAAFGVKFEYAARIAKALNFSLDALLETPLPKGEQNDQAS